MDYLALFGSPLAHSLSPQIHKAFAKQFDIKLQYEPIETLPGQLSFAVGNFRLKKGTAANVTVPLKVEAYSLCDHHFARAKNAKVVNTLWWDEKGLLWGDNTDGEGLIHDLIVNKKIPLQDKSVLLLGAGGAAQGILASLAPECKNIVIVNRTLEKALELSASFDNVIPYTYEALHKNKTSHTFDLVINATSSSLQKTLPPLHEDWIKSAITLDLAYQLQGDTLFVNWAKTHGAKAAYDGLGMLVEQAALAFERWYQEKPKTEKIIQQLTMLAL